ncbi:MAG: alpha-L-fucosidase [Dysgonomonas sp.]|nr:alpha-L-fucosidase [Dysgonomonas sp.]
MKYPRFYKPGLLSLSLLFAGAFSSCDNTAEPPKPYGVIPSEYQVEWQKMEYYMFIHFGPNTFTDVEWGDGKEDPKVFNPTDLDCKQWAATAKAAGMQGIIITAKHHDGFCLWPSKYSTHTVRESLWKDGKGDILKELSEACKEYGLKFGVYLSPWDQNHPTYGTAEYNQVFANTLDEVLSSYGEIFEQWFDGANGGHGHPGKKQEYDWNMFHNVVYKNQPQAIIFSDVGPGCRWMGNERGVAGETNWSRLNVKGFEPGAGSPPTDTLNIGNIHGEAWVPAETDVSIRPGWFYSPSTNDKVKSIDHLVDIYHTSIGRNSNLLLNVPPDRRGRIHPNDSVRLMEFKKAINDIFSDDLTKGATITASSTRGKSSQYKADNLLDEDYDTYWTTDEDILSASFELDLGQEKSFNRILLQEYIPLGQRVAKFNVEVWKDGQWEEIATATTIGYKRILRFPTVSTSKVRVNIQNSLACPVLSKVGLFVAPEKLSVPTISRNKEGMVKIECPTPEPVIYYSTDGSEPTTIYKGEFALPAGGTVKAMATIANGKEKSEVISSTFDIASAKWAIVSPQTDGMTSIIDGNYKSSAVIKNNEAVIINLGESLSLKGINYTPVANEKANNVYRYNLYTSTDGTAWNKVVANGSFTNIKNNPIKQQVLFNNSANASFIKFEPLQNTNNKADYTIAEIEVVTK